MKKIIFLFVFLSFFFTLILISINADKFYLNNPYDSNDDSIYLKVLSSDKMNYTISPNGREIQLYFNDTKLNVFSKFNTKLTITLNSRVYEIFNDFGYSDNQSGIIRLSSNSQYIKDYLTSGVLTYFSINGGEYIVPDNGYFFSTYIDLTLVLYRDSSGQYFYWVENFSSIKKFDLLNSIDFSSSRLETINNSLDDLSIDLSFDFTPDDNEDWFVLDNVLFGIWQVLKYLAQLII